LLAATALVPACGKSHSAAPQAAPSSVVSVVVSPSSANVVVGGVQTFSASISGTPNTALTWSVNGIPGGNGDVGTIQPTGTGAQYFPTTIPNPDPVTVTATLQADPAASGGSTVTVEYANNTAAAQSFPILLGTSGGNATDFTTSPSVTVCCSGTLGCLVRRDGTFFILSNNHVMDRSGQGSIGDPIVQPGLIDNDCRAGAKVATLSQAAPLQTSNVDAALAQIVPGAVATSGSILDLGPAGNTTIESAPPSSTLGDPTSVLAAGGRVAKSGRSTGLTCGPLISINTDVSVDYATSCEGPTAFTVIFRNQLLVDGGSFSAAGDSGSLIVTSDTARPLGLLYGGNGDRTVAHPIADVLNALQDASSKTVPAIVGDADHAVSCAPIATVGSTKLQKEEAPPPPEFTRVSAAKDRRGPRLLEDPAVAGLGIGTSRDNPAEGALLVYVRGTPRNLLPHQVDGVRTRIVRLGEAPQKHLPPELLLRAVAVKDWHSSELFGKRGVVGVGVGRSEDAEGEPALMLYVERGAGFAGIDVEIEGLRTRVVVGERFRTFGWGKSRGPGSGCCGDH